MPIKIDLFLNDGVGINSNILARVLVRYHKCYAASSRLNIHESLFLGWIFPELHAATSYIPDLDNIFPITYPKIDNPR